MSLSGSLDPRAPAAPATGSRIESQADAVQVERLNALAAVTPLQACLLLAAAVVLAGFGLLATRAAVEMLRAAFWCLFGAVVIWRASTILSARAPATPVPLPWPDLPSYTLIVPLLREAEMLVSLLAALDRIDYPRDRLQVVLALEWDDVETRAAAARLDLPPHVQVLIVPPGRPRTKPRACNAALAVAQGEHVVVFDAEDQPHPGQLLEAAARFHAASTALACFQAPLRIPLRGSFTMRQFALEYAALFELMLPALARLGAPFPLGGTSNHFRTSVLREIGGWDPWNVTEDADVGFRLAAAGYRSGMLALPTLEEAPHGAREWMPQRARWLKGYMQTWLVHMRRPWAGGFGRFVSLQATVGLSVISALIHAPTAFLIAFGVIASTTPWGGGVIWPDLTLFGGGWGVAALAMSSGATRAGLKPRLSDGLFAPVYWSLQSVAFWRALAQLITRPHHWDKTPHHPPDEATPTARVDGARADRLGGAA